MMTFEIQDDNFILDGRKVFLISGEIHYFRIRRELWDVHLDAAVEAGLRTISTYIPWAWHEETEGVFDFDGSTCPERDLNGWIARCQARGLTCILKPGPFILAEFRGAGLPDWFMDQYRDQVRMRSRNGAIVPGDGVSLFNKVYLEKVTRWYDRIMPFIAARQRSAGGPVIMMQICNEIGVFSWLSRQADYGNGVKERYIDYLREKFSDIGKINSLWETGYESFEEVEMPPDSRTPYASKADRARDQEWHSFWRRYYGDYLRMLTLMARERGVTLPLYHNLPGWIYGNGYEFPVNITMYDDLFGHRSEIMFGVDHIPEFLSYRNLHDDRIINDITGAMQGRRPLFAAEFQSGSREYHVVTNPREMALFYKASVANGLTGWNYYMFSQGRNPARKGYSGETFYWFNPLTANGSRTSAFPLVKRMNQILSTAEKIIVEARRNAEVCVLFYPPYYATELERPADAACELQFVPSAIRRPAYFDGLLKILQVLNIDYDMADLTKTSAAALRKYRQVWAFATDEMDGPHQQIIVDYTSSGGHTVIFPFLPDRDLSQKPCTILRDAVGVLPTGREVIDSPLVDLFDQKDIKCANPLITWPEGPIEGYEVIARTIHGTPCGFTTAVDSGTLTHLGTWLGFDTEGHRPAYEALLNLSPATLRKASADSGYITVRERFAGDSALLFIGNYYNEEHDGKVYYTHPESGETIPVPCTQAEMTWPPLYGILTPVCFEVAEGVTILHSTSDLLSVSLKENLIVIILHGDRDLPGEIVFEGAGVQRIGTVTLDGNQIGRIHVGSRIAFNYQHKHQMDMTLVIEFNP